MSTQGHTNTLGTGMRVAAGGDRRASTGSWILGPWRDLLLVVAAPVLVLLAAVALFGWQGAAAATSIILVTHVVMTVAHHLPTFIRIYGDVDLFRRHKWTFLLAPAIPFLGSLSVLAYINAKGYPVENVLYLFIILTLWDPWHFLMQHYGFTRIYDRGNGAPPRLAARMDRILSVGCFVSIMLLCGDWLPEVLEDVHRVAGLPLVLALPDMLPRVLCHVGLAIGVAAMAAYAGYLLHCRRRGWRVSHAKITLYISFFAVMYLAYTPNDWIQALAPGWSFKVGFAIVGIVHMTQYLAIVWHYNRNLAHRPGRARAGLFANAFARGGIAVGVAYTAVCLGYGALLSSQHQTRWLMTILLALGFTSTLLHYYFDGFIWKMRHSQNRENLSLPLDDGQASRNGVSSWWNQGRTRCIGAVLARHTLYFGVPMLLLTIGAVHAWHVPTANYVGHMVQAQRLSEQGDAAGATQAARRALAAMEAQLPLVRKLAALQPTASRHAALAFLLHDRARYRWVLMPSLDGESVPNEQWRRYASEVAAAAGQLERALDLRGAPAHEGRERMTANDARRIAAAWRAEVASIEQEIRG